MTTEELEAENTRLREVVESFARDLEHDFGDTLQATELRARAFPPKMETVTEKAWMLKNDDGSLYGITTINEVAWAWSGQTVELSGTYQRPIPAKVKRREELQPTGKPAGLQFFCKAGHRYFDEWEE